MEKRTSSFEDHLSVIESGHQKTASKTLGRAQNDNLLAKLAAELGVGESESPAVEKIEGGAPMAEGEREAAGAGIAGAVPEVASQLDGVVVPQIAITGGDPARQEAGMVPHMMAPQGANPVIATGENTATSAQAFGKTPDAVAAAARGVGGAQTGPLESSAVAQQTEAEKIGYLIASSFQKTLEKQAQDAEYTEALGILKEAGLLDSYNIKDPGIEKTASHKEGCLEKIANNLPLSKEDVIGAAYELVEMNKQAADAEAQGRADAHAYVEMYENMRKEAQESVENDVAVASEQEKVAELKSNPDVMNAVKILKENGLI